MARGESALFIGEGSLVVPTAEHWLDSGHAIVAIASRDRGIGDFARSRDIPVLDPGDKQALLAHADERPFTTLFSVVNLTILPDAIICLASKRAINFHDAVLPRYAGVHATTWALTRREARHGVTWHEMTGEADAGRILVQRSFDIVDGETAFSLNARCYAAGIESFEELTARITDDTLHPVDQDLSQRTYFGMRDRPGTACLVDFATSAADIAALVRALDFGPYANPVGRPRVLLEGNALLVERAERADGSAAPGEVTSVDGDSITVGTREGIVRLCGLSAIDGGHARLPVAGARFSSMSDDTRSRLAALSRASAGDEGFFLRRLGAFSALALPFVRQGESAGEGMLEVPIPPLLSATGSTGVLAAVAAFLARAVSEPRLDVALSEPRLDAMVEGYDALFSDEVPLAIDVSLSDSLSSVRARLVDEMSTVRKRSTWAKDLLAREPALRAIPRRDDGIAWSVAVRIEPDVERAARRKRADFTVAIAEDGTRCRWLYDTARIDGDALPAIARQIATFLARVAESPTMPLASVSLVSDAEEMLLRRFSATRREVPASTVHAIIEARSDSHPDDIAIRFRDQALTFSQLDARANAVARALLERGVGPDALVGVYVDRSPEMVIACLAVWKAGGAYVPLDPAYPAERIAFMVADAGLRIVLTQRELAARLPASDAIVLTIDRDELAEPLVPRVSGRSTPESLAYVIYTSGSTGQPKGVMVEHRNVVNFFAGMDERLQGDVDPGVWLAVTSLSFDISVLELFWTLARGFTVVLYREPSRRSAARRTASQRPVALSLFYFSADEGESLRDKYRLLTEGARFADQHGFVAVWTPERHFHAFGGLYPNPAVMSAALAMITTRVSLRAGSCVSPLHSPIRIAEDWSLVDNLSGGRVGISFAAGWQPNDFVIRPEGFADRKNQMFRDIDTVRRLWRGEAVSFKDGTGRDVPTSILPRPVQAELPIWVTTAGNPETFEEAGRVGANLLTHLLGQTFDELAKKVAIYRQARAAAGHAGPGIVSLMLHTFVGPDKEVAKETVRGPMKGYLKSAVGLIKDAAWSFPTFKQSTTLADGSFGIDHLAPEEMDALLDHAFERYYATSGFFGDVETALAMVDRVRSCDLDEIACLIDFGIASDTVLAHLPSLALVREEASPDVEMAAAAELDLPLAAMIERHGVTHLQCTPSMATMLTLEEDGRTALGRVQTMLVGGEALQASLARDLRHLVPGRVVNMYGPTETTIWSTTWEVPVDVADVFIGTPIANTDVVVLDANLGLAPIGALGELGLGGQGVVRGYLGRDALTAERFVTHPWRAGELMYRTGDLVRFRPDGVLEFHGRLDHQVKIRGHRIELGEIESQLALHASVREAVVVAREHTPGDKRLVAYLVAQGSVRPGAAELRLKLGERLPEFMVPSAFVWLDRYPLTPNKKIDRRALASLRETARPATDVVRPEGKLEQAIAGLWCEALGVATVGIDDNFFDLGGHSLLTVRVLAKLKPLVDSELSLVDLFRFPTVRQLARFIARPPAPNEELKESAARAAVRKEGLQRRAGLALRRRGPQRD